MIKSLRSLPCLLAALALVPCGGALAGSLSDVTVDRTMPGKLRLSWTDPDPVDVLASDRPDAPIAQARLLSERDGDGHFELDAGPSQRLYLLVRDRVSGEAVRAAERQLPLAQASNFRDMGGYATTDGRHVRWGRLYRSAATPLLTESDRAAIGGLGLRLLIDLRSSEERVLAPTAIDGIPYLAVGYPMESLVGPVAQRVDAETFYRRLPTLLAPQIRTLFSALVRDEGPVAINCSAGQDRTGFVAALLLDALGVPEETVMTDYHLSTRLRRPEFELPRFDPALFPDNAAARYFGPHLGDRAAMVHPLFDAEGRPLLGFAFDEIRQRWGSPAAYLRDVAGISDAEIGRIRALNLE